MNNPYHIIKSRYVTEKATVLEGLHTAQSNRSLKRCENPKYVFLVDKKASKPEIKSALETIYSEQKITVVSVNTIQVKSKPTRRTRAGRPGSKTAFKKAVVTLEKGDRLESV